MAVRRGTNNAPGSGRPPAAVFLLAAALGGALLAGPAAAESTRKLLPRDVPAGPLDVVLRRLAMDSDEQILVDPALVAGWRGQPLVRGMPLEAALVRLLRGAGLTFRRVGPGVLVIVRRTATPDETGSDPDILVTALRRPSLLSDTGPALTVVPGAAIERQRAPGRASLTRLLPALIATSTAPLQQRLSVRGVIGTGESTVGVYIGETPVSAPSGTGFDPAAMSPDIDLIDVERIELLRGPQGTLYGASSMGGTLRMILREADATAISGSVTIEGSATLGGQPGAALAVVANVPIVRDRLALRGVIGRRTIGGSIDNPRLGYHDGDSARRNSERLSLGWTPDDALRIDATYLAQRNRVDDGGAWRLDAGRQQTDAPVRVPNSERLRLANVTARGAWQRTRMTATLSHYDWQVIRQIDFTNVLERQRDSDAACLRYAVAWRAGGCDDATRAAYHAYLDSRLPAILYQPMAVRSTSGEWRLSDDGNGAWRWTFGAFAEHRVDRVDSIAARADPASGLLIEPLDVTGLRRLDMRLDQQAVYAEVGHAVARGLDATVGLRVYRYVRAAGGSVPVPNIVTGTGSAAEARYRTTARGRNLKFALDWRPGSKVVVRAIASEGFRPGGVNITPELTADERIYRADHLWNYELGLKWAIAGRAVTAEASAFHIDWDGTTFLASSSNGAFSYNTNLPGVDIDGIEARLGTTIGAWRASVETIWLDARLAADTPVGPSDGMGMRGDALPHVPVVSYAISADWRHDVAGGVVTLGLSASGSSGFDSAFGRDNPYREHTPARFVTDLYATWSRGRWTTRVGVDNVFNAVAATRVFSSAFGMRQIYAATPLTGTLSITRRFD
ncbi:TonB-dependent receptor plug domain-containing protein [Sphingomonas sp.]|uniref:TonB-dependent receptor plug domain-containing protein n=1 Tax=Sphingomonas sp. TaxID=28214 RepID=UPI0035C7902D